MGRSIYLTDLEIEKLIDYTGEAVNILGEADATAEQTEIDMENGLGSAITDALCLDVIIRNMPRW